jgi:N-acetyl-1-D-myo-inositol-2-amino-2-deoxy-alpha-D-glucopyranoside deacetylase/mycothiol S-conjugate amidase
MMAFAHPDDESFGPSGTIVHYARQGAAVHYVCATRGEAGYVDPALLQGYGSVAQLRTLELMCAARHLDLAAVHFLGYHDSGMEGALENQNPACLLQAPLGDVIEKITRLIRQIRPQVIVTFDPQGGYFHPDHIKMHQATTAAFFAAGEPDRFPKQIEEGISVFQPKKLYYTAFPRTIVKWMVRIMPFFGRDPSAWGRNKDIDLLRIAAVNQIVTTQIKTVPYFKTRSRAAACHASQMAGHRSLRRELFDRFLFRWDNYTLVYPPGLLKSKEHDLFAGIKEQAP